MVVLSEQPTVEECEEAFLAGAQRYVGWSKGILALASLMLELVNRRRVSPPAAARSLVPLRTRRQQEFESHLERLLVECQGNIARVAERLQRDRSTVTYHLKKLGLFDPSRSRNATGNAEPRRERTR